MKLTELSDEQLMAMLGQQAQAPPASSAPAAGGLESLSNEDLMRQLQAPQASFDIMRPIESVKAMWNSPEAVASRAELADPVGMVKQAASSIGEMFRPITQEDRQQIVEPLRRGEVSQTSKDVAMALNPLTATTGRMSQLVAPAQTAPQQAAQQATGELLEASAKHNVPLTYSDITGKARKADVALESVPLAGTAGFRGTQHDAALAAAKEVSEQAQSRIGGLAPEQVAQQSLTAKAGKLKGVERKLYDDINAAAAGAQVTLPRTAQTIDDLLIKESQKIQPDEAMMSYLQNLKGKLSDPNKSKDFANMHALRSDLGDDVASFYSGKNALMGSKGAGTVKQLRDSITSDMEDFATQQGGDLLLKWKRADRFHKERIVPYREKDLADLSKIQDPTQLQNKFMSMAHGKPDTLYQAMGPKGRDAIKASLVGDAFETAVNQEGTKFSPAKWAGFMDRKQNELGVFFRGRDKAEIDGFNNLMRHAERAGQFMENPPTGNRLLSWMLAGATGAGAYAAPQAVAAGYGAAYMARLMFTTGPGKAFLLKASKLQPGTPAMQKELSLLGPRLALASSQLQDSGNGDNDREKAGVVPGRVTAGPIRREDGGQYSYGNVR